MSSIPYFNTPQLPGPHTINDNRIKRLQLKNQTAQKIVLNPYILVCPREECSSKLLYLQGSSLVFRPENSDKLLHLEPDENTNYVKVVKKEKIPSDVLNVIDSKRHLIFGSQHTPKERSSSSISNSHSTDFSESEKIPSQASLNQEKHDFHTTQDSTIDHSENHHNQNFGKKPTEGFYWSVSDVFSFENIGISKPVNGGIQYLICAECECGPLGFHDTETVKILAQETLSKDNTDGTTEHEQNANDTSDSLKQASIKKPEYLLSVNRVRYQKI
ncbi:hypothetical protein BB558_006353 [Smittium angustum]|uniref:Uncharacterized protein n=1 Tax=Smittium angustum TaxID=133377 RepID=A0A2U1IY22_SMIAN|nr:hypothetical protein BB558_006353 [Smittium angustum]